MCSMKKLLTRILTAVLLMPVWGWGFLCKGWKLLPARWCLPTLQQCIWQPLLASYLLFQCLGDYLMFKGSNITADCISCIVPPFFPSPLPSPLLPVILFEEGRIEFWLKCCRNCTASALWCQHVMYGLGWKRLWLPQRSQRIYFRLDNFLPL